MKLNEQQEVAFEKKVTNYLENAEDVESHFTIKRKYVKDFIDGKYSMEKNIRKMRESAKSEEETKEYEASIKEIQTMIKEEGLSPGTEDNS